MKKSLFLQVRLDSSRLPGKALKMISGRTVIEHAMNSLRNLNIDDYVLVTAAGDEDKLIPLADRFGFDVFAGDRQDVLKRYIDAGRKYNSDLIVRATGDNPLVSWEMAQKVISAIEKDGTADYMAMKHLPVGCGVEVFRRKALEAAYALTSEPYDHEHVTPFLYNHPEQFKLEYLEHFPPYSHRVTLDTQDDYDYISSIFTALYDGSSPVSFESLKEFLRKND